MDALKGCTSNVHILKDIDTTRFRLYVCEELQLLSGIVKDLRDEGWMCSVAADRLCIFHGAEEDGLNGLSESLHLELQGTIAEHNQTTMPSGRSIISAFLDALEESFTFALLHAHNALKLSPWTWLLSDAEQCLPGIVVHMQTQIAEDNKKLNIAISVRPTNLSHLADTACLESRTVIIAPSGVPALLVSEEIAGVNRDRPASGPAMFRNGRWKDLVHAALAEEGIVLPNDVAWVNVIPNGVQQQASWPAPLCFSPIDRDNIDASLDSDLDCWSRWFDCPDAKDYEDPLSFAEEWALTFAGREQAMYTGEATADDDTAMDGTSNVRTQIENATFDVSSPPLTNRPDLQALHGIYPTPPDGLAVHSVTHMQVQPDNTAAPTAEIGHPPNFTPSDPAPEGNIPLFDGNHDVEGDAMQRNHSIVSSIGPPTQDWNRGSTDDLFGDMEDLEYGREEVGDADFNFFDEPDAVPPRGDAEVRPFGEPGTSAGNNDMSADLPSHDGILAKAPAASDETLQTHHKSDLQENGGLEQGDDALDAGATSPSGHDVNSYTPCVLEKEQASPDLQASKVSEADEMKPLSPFGIREALLPPPIPASASHGLVSAAQERRRSSFGPLAFNLGGTFAPQSSTHDYSDFSLDERKSSYDFGPTRVPLTAISESSGSVGTPSSIADIAPDAGVESGSEADSLSTASDHECATAVNPDEHHGFISRKRKRTLDTSAYCGPQATHYQHGDQTQRSDPHNSSNGHTGSQQQDLLTQLLGKTASPSIQLPLNDGEANGPDDSADQRTTVFTASARDDLSASSKPTSTGLATTIRAIYPNLTQVFSELKPADLVMISQIVAEQAVTATRTIAHELAAVGFRTVDATSRDIPTLQELDVTFNAMSLAIDSCDIPSLVLIREPVLVQRPQPTQGHASQASQARHPPRPPPRIDQAALAPDILPLTASFIRAQRGDCSWEMAPTALNFWETLGLGPVSGPKDIRQFCVAPDNIVLELPIAGFMQNLRAAYESCKFGSMALGMELDDDVHADDASLIHHVALENQTENPLVTALQAYWHACAELGAELSMIGFDEPGRTFVVSMINPFPSTTAEERTTSIHFLCACFLNLSKAYRTAAAQKARIERKPKLTSPVSDIDFKILPIELVASSSSLVVPTAQQMRLLARELYDRCPPSSDAVNESSPLSNAAAPSVELVAPLTKRINFQLTSDPPNDLMLEASVLHVAYATSADGKWANVVWHDNTGRYTNSNAFCLQGRSFAELALEVWKTTMDLIKAREVLWRIFITATGDNGVEASRSNCWKDIIAHNTERKQLLSVTLIHFQPDLALSILPPSDSQLGQGPGSGAPTPAATPQPGIPTTSPEAIGTGNTTITAPPTPAPSEAASGILEVDPEAHLVETEDETWGILIDRDVAATLRPPTNWTQPTSKQRENIEALAHGVLIKRGKTNSLGGDTDNHRPYPCAGASLVWTLRVRAKSDRPEMGERPNVDEGNARHAEVMLREVMAMFRNLGLLSKVKGLDSTGLVPVHIAIAARGAEGLNGLLGRGSSLGDVN